MKKKYKPKVMFIIIIILLVAGLGTYVAYKYNYLGKDIKEKIDNIITPDTKKLNILDLSSDSRPYAVMIDNVAAARPQHGIQEAYIIYEIIVEGGLTRLLALYKDVDVPQIGPIRSTRHYFIDYALENDAIFVHHGWSPQAQSDISSLKISNLNGLYNPSNMFWRDSSLHKAPHNSYSSTKKMQQAATNKKYRTTSADYILLDYSVDDFVFEEGLDATDIKINYSKNVYSSYLYDDNLNLYLKGVSGNKHIDGATNKQLTVKNIIIVNDVSNHLLDDNAGRQELANVGAGSGYYITNGKAIKINWEKKNRNSQTTYKDLEGNSIKVNDGNTFIHIQPVNQSLVIK